jgi:hypothetical protein
VFSVILILIFEKLEDHEGNNNNNNIFSPIDENYIYFNHLSIKNGFIIIPTSLPHITYSKIMIANN